MTKRRTDVNEHNISDNLQDAFDVSDAYTLSNIMTNRFREVDSDGWQERAVAFMTGLIEILVWKRDNSDGKFKFDISVLESYINIKSAVVLSLDGDIPLQIKEQLIAYINATPSMNDAVKEKIVNEDKPAGCSEIYRHHGFITMQLTGLLRKIKS